MDSGPYLRGASLFSDPCFCLPGAVMITSWGGQQCGAGQSLLL